MSSSPSPQRGDQARPEESGRRAHRAGAFDIRVFIASLIGIYGIVLVITGLVASTGRTVNLWAGVAMVVAAAVFIVWARLRPVVVPDDPEELEQAQAGGH